MKKIYLNEGWKFTSEFSEKLCEKDCDESGLELVRIPHTVKELPFHYFDESEYQMVSGYRRILSAPKEWEGKTILFTCEGVAHESELYVNGNKVCTHSCGYTAFTADITKYLLIGEENILVMRVDSRESLNVPPFGYVIDYMTYGGIYRDVYVEVKEPTYMKDVFVKGKVTEYKGECGKALLCCQLELAGFHDFWEKTKNTIGLDNNISEENKTGLHIKGYLKQRTTEFCSLKDEARQDRQLVFEIPTDNEHFETQIELEKVLLWSGDSPALYILELELWQGDGVVDTYTTSFGFRNVEFKTNGFYLNGKKIKLRGLNRHQSYPYVGYAMPESMQKLDADILKFQLGCNAARTSHYPQSHSFIDRCDEIGLLVFTEIPGWQHIGDESWKEQACVNTRDMILQYRNHPSIMLWGVRINESVDDDEFYKKTNEIAHKLDDTRPTGGVRANKQSHLLEDVYTYNDFLHNGETPGCEPKNKVTSDMSKPYLVSEYNGHMYPTKTFDCEEHRLEHAMRHVNVLDAIAGKEDIVGSFGWCMFDYNTHKDFGSGDRICYHGVMDMFRNPKLAASVYASQQDEQLVMELSSSMDIGEHPASNLGKIFLFTNADSVRMYKNDHFIKEYTNADTSYKNMKHGPILIDDFIGDLIEQNEDMPKAVAQKVTYALNYIGIHGFATLPPKILWLAAQCVVLHHMKMDYIVSLYGKYIGNWGGTATEYRFDAIRGGKVVKSIAKKPMTKIHLETKVSHSVLQEKNTYDVAQIRIRALDEKDNVMPYFQEPLTVTTEGPIQLIGPSVLPLKGGMSGVYVRTTGEKGNAKVTISCGNYDHQEIMLEVC